MNHSYTKTIWEDAPSNETPLSADNLNNMENGIAAIYYEAGLLEESVQNLQNEVDPLAQTIEELENEIDPLAQALSQAIAQLNAARSHIGMIIMSTTLDTMAKVIEVYGGSEWLQHSGYVLRASAADVESNRANSDGGSESVTLTESQMPAHTHAVSEHRHAIGRRNVYVGNGSAVALVTYGAGTANDAYTGDTELVIESAGAGEAHNNMPPYKNVYIWERIQ